jgi:hypothetical protein
VDTPSPERLKPLFRDVDELAASFDLTTAIRDALLAGVGIGFERR